MNANPSDRTTPSTGVLAALVGAALLLAACGRDASTTDNPLAGSTWEMTAVRDDELVGANPTSIVVAEFDADTVSGFAGCNDYRFSYSIDGASVSLDDLSVTGRACKPTDFAPQEDAFLAAMSAAARFDLTDDELALTDENGDIQVRFRPAAPLPLTGIAWRLEGYTNQNRGMTSPLAGTRISLALSPDGTLSGLAGCNEYHADYVLADDVLTLANITSTERACADPDGIITQEPRIPRRRPPSRGISPTLTRLELLDPDGNVLADYRFAGRVR